MSFDIAALDVATAAEAGSQMDIVGLDGQVVRHDDGTPVTITLLGKHSARVREAQRRIQNRRLEAARRGRSKLSAEEIEAEQVEMLAAATVDWSFDSLAGQPFRCSAANALMLYADPRFANIRAQADAFISDDGNFTRG